MISYPVVIMKYMAIALYVTAPMHLRELLHLPVFSRCDKPARNPRSLIKELHNNYFFSAPRILARFNQYYYAVV